MYLHNKYGLKILHSSSETQNDLQYHLDLLEENNIVLDRYNLGEFAYPLAYARQPKLMWKDQTHIFNTCGSLNAIYIIMFSSDLSVLTERLSQRGDTKLVLSNIKALNELYMMASYYLSKKYNNIYGMDMAYIKDQCQEFERIKNLFK